MTDRKATKLANQCKKFLAQCEQSEMTICCVAQLLGNLAATMPANPFAKLYSRALGRDKIQALSAAKGNYDGKMTISADQNWIWLGGLLISMAYLRICWN